VRIPSPTRAIRIASTTTATSATSPGSTCATAKSATSSRIRSVRRVKARKRSSIGSTGIRQSTCRRRIPMSCITAATSCSGRPIDQHRMNDFAPYVFATTGYGRTWRNLSSGLQGYVHVVLEDPRSPNLVYAGTELGIFASFDRGAHWTDLRLGLPHLAVVDMK